MQQNQGNLHEIRRNYMLLGFLIGIGALACLYPFYAFFASRVTSQAPAIAGQSVPEKAFDIDFTKRYDFIGSSESGNHVLYRNCRILGFTKGKEGSGSSFTSSYSSYGYFDTWLVIELEDGRKAYIPPNEIRAFEETKPK